MLRAPRLAELTPDVVEQALAGRADRIRTLVDALTPVIQARVARGLLRRGGARGRDARQEVEDMTQEVFLSLFDDDGHALRAWVPARGLSLANFVGLVAERQVSSILRSGRRSPWTEDPTDAEALDVSAGSVAGPEGGVVSRDLLAAVVERVREELSPKGLILFQLLVVDEASVEAVCAEMSMLPDAVYAWRSRLAKLVRRVATELQ